MTANSDKSLDMLGDQLANLEDQLVASADDVALLTDVQSGIGTLLADNGGNEAEIRRVLQERYDAGALRKETFQLVKSMLDRYVTEDNPTSPLTEADRRPRPRGSREPVRAEGHVATSVEGDDAFGSTTVIPDDSAAAAADEARAQVGSLLRDRFLLQEQISGGSMGVVYKALDRRLSEAEADEPWVAIKVLSPKLAENAHALRALQQEAAKGRCLQHRHIVRFIDFDRDDELYFLVMEWLQGRTLANILDSSDAKTIDQETAFRIVGQIGEALEYAHSCGIVHADVKPGNVMIMPGGDAKLFDFGVARVRQKQLETDFDPGVLGALTPAYSSMQVLTGEDPVAADDVFSLACLLYRLVAGYRVFGPRNAAEASQEGMTPQRPQGLSERQWGALKKALSYARVTRFSSVQEFLDAFQDSGEDTITPDPAERIVKENKRSARPWVLAFILLLTLAAAGAYRLGYLDSWWSEFQAGREASRPQDAAMPVTDVPAELEDAPLVAEPPTEFGAFADMNGIGTEAAEPEPASEPLIDFSTLPPADLEIPFAMGSPTAGDFKVRLREDDGPVRVDFIRSGSLSLPLSLKLDEVGFSGNRSPWAAGQYTFSGGGVIRFPVGQDRSRIVMEMASDPLREADQLSTLRLRELDSVASELAVLYVTLEDDDQRVFENQLSINTIAFAASQASIREADPAVQIDLVRFNPDDSRVVVRYTVSDVTATQGEDYFATGDNTVTFGPGQRSARLLIPLVQDSLLEGDEAFVIELANNESLAVKDVYKRIVVMIRDDDP